MDSENMIIRRKVTTEETETEVAVWQITYSSMWPVCLLLKI